MKAPNSNIQAPEKYQAPNFKKGLGRLTWSLKFGISLELGAWDLEV
jgi:hypothetical protein